MFFNRWRLYKGFVTATIGPTVLLPPFLVPQLFLHPLLVQQRVVIDLIGSKEYYRSYCWFNKVSLQLILVQQCIIPAVAGLVSITPTSASLTKYYYNHCWPPKVLNTVPAFWDLLFSPHIPFANVKPSCASARIQFMPRSLGVTPAVSVRVPGVRKSSCISRFGLLCLTGYLGYASQAVSVVLVCCVWHEMHIVILAPL